MTKNQHGFTVIELLLSILVIAVICFGGYYVYHTHHKTKYINNTKSQNGFSSSSAKQVKDFFSCVNDSGVMATSGNASCTLNGQTYAFPANFTTEDITNYNKVPISAQPLVLTLAKKNFNGFGSCVKDSQTPNNAQGTYPNVIVSIAGSQFVLAAVNSCDNGYSEEFGLNGGAWTDLGIEQLISVNESTTNVNGFTDGFSCNTVSTYNITKADVLVVNPFKNPTIVGYDSCVTAAGNIQDLPN